MHIPEGYTEKEVITIINEAVGKLCHKFKFGPYEIDDIKQEGFLFALEKLHKYDGRKPLPNFIYIVIKNLLINLKRNKYERLNKPCDKCPLKAYIIDINCHKCSLYDNMLDCKYYNKYHKVNSQKKELMHAERVDFDINPSTRGIGESDNDSRTKEMEDYINTSLPVEYRADYLRIKFGHKISQPRRELIEDVLLEILEKGGYV